MSPTSYRTAPPRDRAASEETLDVQRNSQSNTKNGGPEGPPLRRLDAGTRRRKNPQPHDDERKRHQVRKGEWAEDPHIDANELDREPNRAGQHQVASEHDRVRHAAAP